MDSASAWLAVAFVLASFSIGWSGVRVARDYALRAGVLDHPNFRSSHAVPTPLGGGLAIATPFVAGALLLAFLPGQPGADIPVISLALMCGVLTAVGWVEDYRGVPIFWRLAFQAGAGLVFLVAIGWPGELDVFGFTVALGGIALAVSLLWMVWLTNLYNFMDGIDGIAASQAILSGVTFGTWFFLAGARTEALLAWGLAAAAMAFLCWNWQPATIFLGDAGSLMLGSAFGGFALIGVVRHDLPIGAFVLGLGLFIADATWTLLVRILRGEPWWLPHRSHYFQRAVIAGWTHRQVTRTVLAAGAVLSVLATFEAARWGPRWLWPLCGVAILLTLAGLVRARERELGPAIRLNVSPSKIRPSPATPHGALRLVEPESFRVTADDVTRPAGSGRKSPTVTDRRVSIESGSARQRQAR